jgi:hypothetical protein
MTTAIRPAPLEKTPELVVKAKSYFKEWFELHPGVKNPTDCNKKEKYAYFVEKGWSQLKLMQVARKQNKKKYGYPFEWTKPGYWHA